MGDEISNPLLQFCKLLGFPFFPGSSEDGPGLLSEALDSWASSSSRNSRSSESENPGASADPVSSSPVSDVAQLRTGQGRPCIAC